MQITLPLGPETQAQLERGAAGVDVATYVLHAVQRTAEADASENEPTERSYDLWKAEFDAWIARHDSRNPHFDDSRESIYE